MIEIIKARVTLNLISRGDTIGVNQIKIRLFDCDRETIFDLTIFDFGRSEHNDAGAQFLKIERPIILNMRQVTRRGTKYLKLNGSIFDTSDKESCFNRNSGPEALRRCEIVRL